MSELLAPATTPRRRDARWRKDHFLWPAAAAMVKTSGFSNSHVPPPPSSGAATERGRPATARARLYSNPTTNAAAAAAAASTVETAAAVIKQPVAPAMPATARPKSAHRPMSGRGQGGGAITDTDVPPPGPPVGLAKERSYDSEGRLKDSGWPPPEPPPRPPKSKAGRGPAPGTAVTAGSGSAGMGGGGDSGEVKEVPAKFEAPEQKEVIPLGRHLEMMRTLAQQFTPRQKAYFAHQMAKASGLVSTSTSAVST